MGRRFLIAISLANLMFFRVWRELLNGKQAYYTQIDLDQAKAYAYAKEVMSMNALAADAQEGISAFLGKRRPCWSGR